MPSRAVRGMLNSGSDTGTSPPPLTVPPSPGRNTVWARPSLLPIVFDTVVMLLSST